MPRSMPSAASLRVEPVSYMKATLDRFKLGNILESENSKEKLASAGYRGQAPLITFMFFRFVMPFIVFAVTLFYLFVDPASGLAGRCRKSARPSSAP